MRHIIASMVVALLLLVAGVAGPGAAQSSNDDVAQSIQNEEACPFPLSRTDASGTTVTIDSDPRRVVALHPSAAQTMWEIGARDEVVGMPVNQYTSDLEGFREPKDVIAADGYTVNVEVVVDLSPDLVLAPNVTPADTVRQLRRAGLTVYYFREARTIDDVYEKTRLAGRLTGNCAGAEATVAWMKDRIGAVRTAVRGEPRPTVVYPLGGGFVAGSNTFLHELVTAAGGRNLAAEAGISGYGRLSAEVIVARDPQWLVLNEGVPTSAIQMDAYERTTAIRENQIVRVNPNYASQAAPRIVYTIERIARALHPEAMAAANRTKETTEATTSRDGPPTIGTNAPGQPGFGIAAGLLAIVGAFLAATRRTQ